MNEVTVYNCKDGRTRVYLKSEKRVISYPKYLMEKLLGRPLEVNEQVHHKDGNPLNNNIDNLEIRLLGEHQREHATKYVDTIAKCPWCGNTFLWTAKKQVGFYGNHRRKNRMFLFDEPFCSKRCSGEFGAYVQKLNK